MGHLPKNPTESKLDKSRILPLFKNSYQNPEFVRVD